MFNTKLKPGDITANETPAQCLKNVKYKLKNHLNLSNENLSRLSAPDITETKIKGQLDFMQWSLIGNNKNNVILLSKYFDIQSYKLYLETLSLDVQENMNELFMANKLEPK